MDAKVIALTDQIRVAMIAQDRVDDAREAVALRLTSVLWDAKADATSALILPDDAWALAVEIARERDPRWHPRPGYSPSDDTRRRVSRLLALRASVPDPFAGFPQ